jgi:hypothetical protein
MARRWVRAIVIGITLALGATGVGGSATRAADDVPVAHVHQGSCDALGIVVYELGPADAGMDMSSMAGMATTPTAEMGGRPGMAPTPTASTSGTSTTPLPEATQVVSADGSTVASITYVTSSIGQLTNGGYAVNVHAGMESITTYIACGDLGTAAMVGDTAVAALHELDGSGWTGFVVLRPLTPGPGTEIDLYLAHGGAADASTPAS